MRICVHRHIKTAPIKTFGFAESPIHLGSVFPYALSVQNTSRLPLMFCEQVLELAPIIFFHYFAVAII